MPLSAASPAPAFSPRALVGAVVAVRTLADATHSVAEEARGLRLLGVTAAHAYPHACDVASQIVALAERAERAAQRCDLLACDADLCAQYALGLHDFSEPLAPAAALAWAHKAHQACGEAGVASSAAIDDVDAAHALAATLRSAGGAS